MVNLIYLFYIWMFFFSIRRRFFFFDQETAYEICPRVGGSEICKKDSYGREKKKGNKKIFFGATLKAQK